MKNVFTACFLILTALSTNAFARGVKEGGGDSSGFESCLENHMEKIQNELHRDDLVFELSSDAKVLLAWTNTGELVASEDISDCHQ
ncbi:hypothetical protein [Bdellovibrio bacteriovorus]|uniref:Uncharacterized protein n=1 Tax=Bdellovibrio bacteriovorus str. Tiberius TaxID=1069642 RepID=K7YUL1_BDEBC|nr:hypothetical protein [Bdellovibrio bacteriovorus]AFY00345.1 Hypothetical protein Bdt_0637 [Bdellovibrio bacteriovorus str. Tiberius]